TASKRLSVSDTPWTAHAATGSAIPLSSCRPRSRRRNRSPSKRRVEAATTIVPGSAKAWRRAAKFGGCPTTGASPKRPPAARVPDHHHAGRDANANRERFRGARLESAYSSNDIEPRPHGSLGIVFVRDWITEISQYPVAPELGQEAVIGSHDAGAGGVVG